MKLFTPASLGLAISLLTPTLYASCPISHPILEVIESEPVLKQLHDAYVSTSDSQNCAFVEDIKAALASKVEPLTMPSELLPQCDIRHTIALSYLAALNQAFDINCAASDQCAAQRKAVLDLPFIEDMDGQLTLVDKTIQSSTNEASTNQYTFATTQAEASSVFNLCGQVKLKLIKVEKGNHMEVINQILNKGLDPILVSLKGGNTSMENVYSQLKQDNYFDYIVEQTPILFTYGLLTVETANRVYTGGAHGIGGKGFVNIDLNDGKDLTLEDIFLTESKADLLVLTEKALRDWHAKAMGTPQAPSTSMQSLGFSIYPESVPAESKAWSNEQGIYLSTNWYVSNEGIHFVYNPYEIGPYSMGIIDILIEWPALDPHLKQGTAVMQLLNE